MNECLIYTILVAESPYTSQAFCNAVNFVEALLIRGHKINAIFFYHDAVLGGNNLAQHPEGAFELIKKWRELCQSQQIECAFCVSASLRRGIIDKVYAKSYEISIANLYPEFSIKGLSALMEAMNSSHRFIQFGIGR